MNHFNSTAAAEKKRFGLVIGLGKSGIGATDGLNRLFGQAAVYDQKPAEQLDQAVLERFRAAGIETWLGGAEPDRPEAFDLAVVSPGVPLNHPLLERLRAAHVEIISEVELAWRYGQGQYVAITGTNGKTTTTTLTGELFKAAGFPTEVVGNIGVAVTDKAFSATPETWLITEVSSFQLETSDRFHPHISAILNITPDHMDRHHTMEQYARAKARIFQNQTAADFLVANLDDPLVESLLPLSRARLVPFSITKQLDTGCFVKEQTIVVSLEPGQLQPVCPVQAVFIPGAHNLENALAAAAMAFCAGISPELIAQVLRTFPGVEHRLEYSGTVRRVRYVNDSKGTNPDAAIKALEAIPGKLVLIAGGYDKGAEFDGFVKAFGDKVVTVILLGTTAPKIREAALRAGYDKIIMVNDMEEAVRTAAGLAKPGETVLLSPACASWDKYRCFEERGEHFKQCVKQLSIETED